MKPLIIGIGLCLIGAGALLSFVGHYDGILGADDPATYLANPETRAAKTRVIVLGTPAEAQEQFRWLDRELLIPAKMDGPLNSGSWVAVRLGDNEVSAYLQVEGTAPPVGSLLVFEGEVRTYWPVIEADVQIVGSQPILLLEAADYHEPILFKS
jgi:hypothetical protein